MRNRLSALSASVVLVTSVAMAVPVAAQQVIEEIIVTATKREQSLQDVNIAVDALSGDALRELGYTDIRDVANHSPNLNIKYAWGNSMPIYTIRGVGMNSFQASDTPSVGLFIDEVFQSSVVTMGAHLYDMERVEVLKGPQSALFGRNTNGGAVNYISRLPSREVEGFVRADYGKFERLELEGAVGGPLGETVAGRISFQTIQQGDGWVHDRTSGKHIGEVNIFAARAQLLWEPSDDLSVLVKGFGSRDRSEPVYFQHLGILDATDLANGVRRFCDAYVELRFDPVNCVDILGYSDTDGDPYAGEYTDRPDTPVYAGTTLENDNIGFTLRIDKEFGNLTVTSITGWQSYDRYQPKESDGNPGLFVDFLFASDMSAWSQEIRITSNYEGSINWIAGAQVAGDEVAEDPPRIGYFDDLFGLRGRVVYDQERFNAAGYAQVVWQINDQWNLEVGGRVLYDDVEFESTVSFLFPPYTNDPNDVGLVRAICPNTTPPFNLPCELDDTALTGRIALDWSPNENLMVYGSAATGYKPGGFNGGFNTDARLYEPFLHEEVTAFEVGLKSTIADGRAQLNASAFIYDYKGLQAATPRRTTQGQTTVLNFLTNLSAADIKGLEVELRWRPVENLEVIFGAGLLDSENNDPGANFDGPTDGVTLVRSPRKLPNAPTENFNVIVAYDLPLNDGSRVRMSTDYVYEGDHYKNIVNIPLLKFTNEMWNARVTWTSADESLTLTAWGKNLADEPYAMDTLGAGSPTGWGVIVWGMPRTFGFGATWHFTR